MSVAIKDCRLFVWASYLAVGAVFITGCGGEEVDTIEETITVEGRTTVTYWHNHTAEDLRRLNNL
ncbi:hypothetical protein JCM19046_2334 [Bacillus sp. JCM 19046]|nr:hypothetical protein JCM19045_1841 [Bacillus sp. JCM 19045]GAF17806.1 hypothetical protein JCM19046_2334 [Bacillus sp. JCM 19046]